MSSGDSLWFNGLLQCPACGDLLQSETSAMRCSEQTCSRVYPIVDSVPVLIDETHSIFSPADYGHIDPGAPSKRGPGRFLPGMSTNLNTSANFERMLNVLTARTERPAVLVVGGQIAGSGMETFLADKRLRLVETDVTIGPRSCEGLSGPSSKCVVGYSLPKEVPRADVLDAPPTD